MSTSFDLTLDKVRFKNFMSFGNVYTEVDLATPGTTHIMGENLDKGGSSGAGKSTLVAVVAYCFYDKIPSKVSKDKLINSTNDKKITTMEAETYFTKGKTEYVVKRWRGAATGVQLFENGIDITPDSVGNVNAKIEDIVGISYQLFSLIVLFSGNNELFLDSSVGTQRTIMEELFKITTLSQKAVALKTVISETDKTIALQKQAIKHQEQQNENHKKQIAAAELRVQNWNAKHEADLTKATNDVEKISNIDFDSEEEVHNNIGTLNGSLGTIDNDLRILNSELKSKIQEKSPVSTEIILLTSKIKKDDEKQKALKKEHEHLSDKKCPYCLQAFEDANTKITQIFDEFTALGYSLAEDEDKLVELKAKDNTFDQEKTASLAVINEKIETITLERKKITALIIELQSLLTYSTYKEHVDAAGLIGTLQDRIEKLIDEVNPHIDALETLKLEGAVEVDTKELDRLVKLAEHQAFLLKLLTDKNSFIRKNIIAKTIPFLNKRIGYYTQDLNMQHMVLFQPDMSCEISQMGRSLDHGNLSNGEKKVLNLALCLAFRDVRTYMHSKINVLFTDEIDGGSISGPDVDALIAMLKRKSWDDKISIFVISHRPEFEGRTDRSIIVRKEGGFSTIIEQADA